MKIKDEKTGEETEVFTQAEFEVKSKEVAEAAAIKAVEDFKIANPDKSAEVETLKTNLAKATKDLDAAIAAGGNEEQIKRFRKERDEAETKANEGVTKLQKDLEDFKKEVAGDTGYSAKGDGASGFQISRDEQVIGG